MAQTTRVILLHALVFPETLGLFQLYQPLKTKTISWMILSHSVWGDVKLALEFTGEKYWAMIPISEQQQKFWDKGWSKLPTNPWRYRLWRNLAGWAAAAGSLSRLYQTVLCWHVVSTSNPTAAFSAFQTEPLLLYSSNYSVYPNTRLSGPRSKPNSLRKILRSARESNPGPLCL
jgi:hypothetical protein